MKKKSKPNLNPLSSPSWGSESTNNKNRSSFNQIGGRITQECSGSPSCSGSGNPPESGLEIYIDGEKASSNIKIIVGQKVKLTMQPVNGDEISEPEWGIEGITKTKFVHELNDGHTEDLNTLQLKNTTVSFYWVNGTAEGAAKKVTAVAKVDGKAVKAETMITVIQPRLTMQIALLPGWTGVRLSLNPDFLAEGNVSLGVQIICASDISNVGGTITFVQLGNSSRTQYRADGSSDDFHASGLDAGFPYPTATEDDNGSFLMVDRPVEPLSLRDQFNQESMRDEYTTWLMYRPDGAEGGVSNWVPVLKVDWSWWADVVLESQPVLRWRMIGGNHQFGTVSPTTDYPNWNTHIPAQK